MDCTNCRYKDSIELYLKIWEKHMQSNKFSTKLMYETLLQNANLAPQIFLIRRSCASPKVVITIWLVCQGKMAKKYRFVRFGLIQDSVCSLCKEEEESIKHLLFACRETKPIWQSILNQLEVVHDPKRWLEEKPWIMNYTNRKGWKTGMMKHAVTETLHEVETTLHLKRE